MKEETKINLRYLIAFLAYIAGFSLIVVGASWKAALGVWLYVLANNFALGARFEDVIALLKKKL